MNQSPVKQLGAGLKFADYRGGFSDMDLTGRESSGITSLISQKLHLTCVRSGCQWSRETAVF